MSTSLFSKTPSVTVLDNRGLTVRDIAYHRHPGSPDVTSQRITRHQYDARGFLAQSTDPRLHDAGLANFTYLSDLAGNTLRTQGVDNGTTVALNDAAGRPFMAVSNISTADDGREERSQAVTRTWQYEDATLPGRPLSITEQATGEAARITERFVWAGNSAEEKALNLAGACVSHYDTAGLTQTDSVALTGVPLSVTRRLLQGADNPDTLADWQGADASAWNDLLAAEAYTTLTTADASGAVLTTTDAKGNLQRVAYDVAGLLSGSWLTVKDGTEQVIVKSLTYSAAGQKLREEHGNGVVTTYTYEAQTQRLTGIKTERPAGHASGARVLQDLRYEYDPVGNVLKITNDAEETRFWRNQKVVPENTYVYDSLYQLVSATGREMASAGQQSSSSPSATVPLLTDSSAYTSYTRTYTYDNAGNLTQIHHSPATGSGYTTKITVSDRSNRGVLSTLTEDPAKVDALFTAGGQQKQLQPGQDLVWTARNELLKVTPVVRDGDTDDRESYRYDAGSQRILKVGVQKTSTTTQTQRALYLAGLELRSTKAGDTETESLQVITVGEAGRAQVRVLHWESGRPTEITGDQIRYSYDNLTGSSRLELDDEGNIISMEEYYPYGGTAVWTARSQVEANYKTVRYSGKERDATGLYYYGYRFYQPWAGRWLSADPAGTVDGINLFRMVQNNPMTLEDIDGLSPGKRYVYFPFIHEQRILRLTRANLYRQEKGKADLITVVPESDVIKFQEAVSDYFSKGRGVDILKNHPSIKDRVSSNIVHNLNNMEVEDQLIINAHGLPGRYLFYSDENFYSEKRTAVNTSHVADNLLELNLPEFSKIKVSTCHSAEGNLKQISTPFHISNKEKILSYIVNKKGDFNQSLAGNFENYLVKKQPNRKKGNIYGYLGLTTFYGDNHKKTALNDKGKLKSGIYGGKTSRFRKGNDSEVIFKRSYTRTNINGTAGMKDHT